ncbi:MAG: hypothetical protein ACRCUY_10085 [Thermoguttaceae bacterium]
MFSVFFFVRRPAEMLLLILSMFCSGAAFCSLSAEETVKPSAVMLEQVARLKAKNVPLIDYHIHLRGGMTAEKAFEWEKLSGIRSGVLENVGQDWPISDNEKLGKFIADAKRFPVLVGIQVNDRDWFRVIDMKLCEDLDYVLADTMIMRDKNGKPQKLWLEDEYQIDDPQKWLEQYMEHCLIVVDEPIDILANPTYLPPRMAKYYDEFWTEKRMEKLIDAAIANDVAFEIQTGSPFPKRAFIDLARKKGAKWSIGRNNFDDKPNELKRSLDLLEELNFEPNEMLIIPSEK